LQNNPQYLAKLKKNDKNETDPTNNNSAENLDKSGQEFIE
jgi:hypothetical protein